MDLLQAIKERHSVRQYEEKPLSEDHKQKILSLIEKYNKESGLNIQLVYDEPKAFDSVMAHYGNFTGVTNYIALIGKKGKKLEELCGYYGEKLVLDAQIMGLNTCWVALTFKKIPKAFNVNKGEKLVCVITLGYGKTQGKERKSKAPSDVSNSNADTPEWFKSGVEAALLAPTATNQQKFTITQNGEKVNAKAGLGFYAGVDLGIVKYHFEIGAGTENFTWA